MKKALVVVFALILTLATVCLAGCKGEVYDFSIASTGFDDVEQSASADTNKQLVLDEAHSDAHWVTEPENLHGRNDRALSLQ